MRTAGGPTRGTGTRDADDRVLEVLRALTQVTDLASFPVTVLRALRPVIPYDVATYNEVDPLGDRFVAITEPADFTYPPGVIERFIECLDEHPLFVAGANGDGSALRMSDCVDRDTYRATALYRDVYRHLGVEFQMSVTLPAPRPLVVAFALSRTHRDFEDDERARLELLRPHLAHTFHLLRRIELLRRVSPLERAASRRGLVSVGATGAVEPVDTDPALFDRWFAAGNALADNLVDWVRERATHGGRRGGQPDGSTEFPFLVRGLHATLTARIVSHGADGATTLVVEEQLVDAERLGALGLTVRQAEILARLIEGASPGDVARELGISKSTVDKHLEHVYRKLGVATRTDAVAAALDALVARGDEA